MKQRLIHTNHRICFSNPFVYRVRYDSSLGVLDHWKFKNKLNKCIVGTWGYTGLTYIWDEEKVQTIVISYFCIKDSEDAIIFKLTCDVNSELVSIWPAGGFTIHEIVQINES